MPSRSRWTSTVPIAFLVLTLVGMLVVPLLTHRKANALLSDVADVVDPTRVVLGDVRQALARELANVRAYAITGDELYIERYQQLLATERRWLGELRELAGRLGPAATEAFLELEAAADRWHSRPIVRDMAAGQLDLERYALGLPEEQVTWEALLRAAERVEAEVSAAEERLVEEIRATERLRTLLTGILVALALVAAVLAGWLGRRIEDLRFQADRRRSEVERLMESRARLIRGFSHDVKNPLGAADAYLQIMESGTLGELSPKQKQGLERSRRSLGTALRLIDDLVDVARAEAGDIQVDRVLTDVRAAVREAVEEYRGGAASKGLALAVELPATLPPTRTDGVRVRQILGNLLSNAIKYTDSGRVLVRADVRTEGGPGGSGGERAWIVVEVTDTGPGIPREQEHLVFQEFQRFGRSGEAGSGIGLAISRKIANALDGDITLVPASPRGSTFTLWLPLDDARSSDEAAAAPSPRDREAARV